MVVHIRQLGSTGTGQVNSWLQLVTGDGVDTGTPEPESTPGQPDGHLGHGWS